MRRTLATLALGCAALALLGSSSWADCKPLAGVLADIKAAGAGSFKPLSHDQLEFARGMYAISPPAGPYPETEEAEIALFKNGSSAIVFPRGDESCGVLGVPPDSTKVLLDLDKSF
jgi:hypothetical protein